MRPFKFGRVVDGEYLHKGEYKFFNPFFRSWILSKTF